jgi:hypothetical protein
MTAADARRRIRIRDLGADHLGQFVAQGGGKAISVMPVPFLTMR